MVKLAKIYNINVKTVKKWKSRDTVDDSKMGTKQLGSTVLSALEERIIVEFRTRFGFGLDDLFIALKDEMPHLSRSSLHRCLKRHGISRLPKEEIHATRTKKFKNYEIGFLHIDSAEVRTGEGKAYLYVAIDRTSKFALAKLYKSKTRNTACDFLRYVLEKVPYMVDVILTDNGLEFTDIARGSEHKTSAHAFVSLCRKHNIEHRLTKVKHPWTNGQVERMNRTIKSATVKNFHYDTMEQLQAHIDHFLIAYNTAKPLKALGYKTVLQFLMDKALPLHYKFKNISLHYFSGLNN